MRKRLLLIMGAMAAIFLISLLVLRTYQLDMVEVVTVNALIQKAPSHRHQEIRRTFADARRSIDQGGDEAAYLKELFSISQQLERSQTVEGDRLDALLEAIRSLSRTQDPPAS